MLNNGGLLFGSERLEREKGILEERADRKVEILKNLVSKTANLSTINTNEKVTFILKQKIH